MRKSRVLLTAAGLFLGLGCLWVRDAVLEAALHGHFAARARENQQHHEKILPRRGIISDQIERSILCSYRLFDKIYQ